MRLLALVDSPDHVCCRYRVRAFEPALRQAGWSIAYRALARGLGERLGQLSSAAEYDAVLLQRRLLPSWQLSWLRRRARHLVFDFDDAVLYRDSYHRKGPHSPSRARRFAATVRAADAVIAGNDFLADCASRSGTPADRVRVIPTCVDPRRYPAPARSPWAPPRGEAFDLAWIGSSSTLQGIERRRDLWERLGAEVPGARLRVVCDRFPDFRGIPVVAVPWSEASEAAELALAHAGASWIPDDLWSRGKCGLKILQYQAAGLPVVANPVGANAELVEPGVTGFLPGSDDEWVEAVRTLAGDEAMRQRMGETARRRIEAGFSVEAWSETFVSTVGPGSGEPDGGDVRGRPPSASRPGSAPIPRPHLPRGAGSPGPSPAEHHDARRRPL